MKFYLALFLLILSTGCSTSLKQQARLEQRRLDIKQHEDQEQERKRAQAELCTSYGFESNTTSFAQCITQIDQAKHNVIAEYNDRYLSRSATFDGYTIPTQADNAGEAFGRANTETFGGAGTYYNNRINVLPPPLKHNIKCTKNPVNFIVSCQEL
ncbi:MAG: hypothetical protein DID90_2727553895 [Candidatus Nitrotoga sp. LAW]|nr:MAG: hypothetical protein DID90_2727553895 [Candidatus Nitrotoga sp. LAW]